MRRAEVIVLLTASLVFLGCANTVQLAGGKGILSAPRSQVLGFLRTLGYSNIATTFLSRSTTGDRLFVQFEDTSQNYKVAVVSSSGITLADLPGQSCLNDDGKAVFWLSKSRTFKFASGCIVPTNVYCSWASDGKFVRMNEAGQSQWWIARVESPLEDIVTFDAEKEFELLVSQQDRLHVFVRGKPDGKPRADRWFILKHYEYQVAGSKARLLQAQDFYYTWSVMDFEPGSNLMFASSWNTERAHGVLVNIVTGERSDLRAFSGRGYFLSTEVIDRFKRALRKVK